jgi:DNA-binding response OmpR family regulator
VAQILLVDDDTPFREMLSAALCKRGHVVVSAKDGTEGLSLFAEMTFDLVITDIIMPDMEGIGMMLEMRRKMPGQQVLAISGGGRIAAESFLEAARRLGARVVLEKPFNIAALLAALDECLCGDKGRH